MGALLETDMREPSRVMVMFCIMRGAWFTQVYAFFLTGKYGIVHKICAFHRMRILSHKKKEL